MIHPTNCMHVFLVSKAVAHCFLPGLIARAQIEQEEKQKVTHPPPAHPPQECMLSLPIGCMKSFFPTPCYEELTPPQPWIPA